MYHELLYNEAGWMFDPRTGFVDLAERAEVPDLEDFNRCIDSSEPVAAISTDIAAAEKLGGGGTPTLLINGLLVGTYRDTTELFAIVDNALKP